MFVKDLNEELKKIQKTFRIATEDPEIAVYHKGEIYYITEVYAEDEDHSNLILLALRSTEDDYIDHMTSKDD
jgi:hypothetical protein